MTTLARVIDQPTTRIVRPETEDGSGSITSRFGSFQASSARSGVSPCLAMYSPRWLQSISSTITQLYYDRNTKPSIFGLQCTRGPRHVCAQLVTAMSIHGMLVAMPDGAGLPSRDVARVEQWCRDRVPDHLTDQLRVECDATDRHLTILECHPPWRADVGPEWTRFPVARLHFSKARQEWTLYWRDRNLRFHLYERVKPARDVSRLLAEVDRDPTAIFWG